MALLNSNSYFFESFKKVAGSISKYFWRWETKFSNGIVDVISLIIIGVVAIIIGIILAIAYAFLLGEGDVVGWGLSHAVPILFLFAVSIFGLVVSLGVVKAMGGGYRVVLSIIFWTFTLFGPVIWTHLVKLLGAQEMIQYRRWAIFVPMILLLLSAFVCAFIDDVRYKNYKKDYEKIKQKLENV